MGSAREKDSTAKHAPTPLTRSAAPESVPDHGLLGLQATLGNDTVVQALRTIGHPWAGAADPVVQRSTAQEVLRQPGRPLDGDTRSDMESRLGADLSDVRLHDDRAARESAAQLGAVAYTSGSHVVIGEGGGDEHTLAHELTHVIQQREGPVAGTDNGAGLRVSDPSDHFEREAEANARAVMNRAVSTPPSGVQRATDANAAIQRMPTQNDPQWAADADSNTAFNLLDSGTSWTKTLEDNPQRGRNLVAMLSGLNMTSMGEEIGPDTGWQETVRKKVEDALGKCVLRHYTTEAKARAMLAGEGELKSTAKLMQDAPGTDIRGNSDSDIDDLANHGFVFFFIEPKGQSGRDTRFSNEGGQKPARITVPFDLLVRNGWIMLTDFKDQDFPEIRSNAAGELYSYKYATSVEKKLKIARGELYPESPEDPDYTTPANLANLLGTENDGYSERDWNQIKEYITTILERRSEIRELRPVLHEKAQYNTQVRRFASGYEMGTGNMDYMHGAPSRTLEEATNANEIRTYEEKLHGNILAGSDIIPGLASRCVLEISRIEAQGGHDNLANRMRAMSGEQLVGTLLKDFIRPQAMVPWSVAITDSDVETF